MAPAYVGFLHWAIKKEKFWRQFKDETGLSLSEPAKTPIDALIDQACGVSKDDEDVMLQFVLWVTRTHWGEEFAPSFYFKLKKNNARRGHKKTKV